MLQTPIKNAEDRATPGGQREFKSYRSSTVRPIAETMR
jgi:hypothetical protein